MEINEIVRMIIDGNITEEVFDNLIDEQILMTEYGGKSIIDYILEYKRNTEYFDKYAIYNPEIAIKYLDYGLKPNIDNETIFMSKYDDVKTIFEKYIEEYFDVSFLNMISNLIKEGKSLKEILLFKVDNKYIFEYLEEKGLNTIINYLIVANDKDIAFDLVKRGYDNITLYTCDINILESYIDAEKNVFDVALSNAGVKDNDLSEIKFRIKYDIKSVPEHYFEFLSDKEPLWLLAHFTRESYKYTNNPPEYLDILFTSFSSTLKYLDVLLMSNLDMSKVNELAKSEPKLAQFYVKHGKFDELANASYDVFNTMVDGKLVIEHLIANIKGNNKYAQEFKAEFLNRFINIIKETQNEKWAEIAYNYGLMVSALSCEGFLLRKSEINDELFLENIIQELIKTNKIFDLGKISYTGQLLTYKSKSLNNQMVIEFLMDNGLFSMQNMSMDLLLFQIDNGKTILEFLIEKNRDLVINWIKEQKIVVDNLEMLYILQSNNIFPPTNIAQAEREIIKQGCLKKAYSDRINGEIDLRYQKVLEQFKQLMMSDGRSDEEIVDLACASFKEQFANDINGDNFAWRDLSNLFKIKHSFPSFCLKRSSKGTYFDPTNYCIAIENIYSIDAFNHEMGHLFHYCCKNYSIPDLIKKMIERFDMTKIVSVLKDYFTKITEESFSSFSSNFYSFLTSPNEIGNYAKLLNQFKQASKDGTLEINQEHLQYLSNRLLSQQEFNFIISNIFEQEIFWDYGEISGKHIIFSVADIIDALSGGKLVDDSKGLFSGHGSKYYCGMNHPFMEIIAQYATIIKSPQKDEMLRILTELTSKEFVLFLDEYYLELSYEQEKNYGSEEQVNYAI